MFRGGPDEHFDAEAPGGLKDGLPGSIIYFTPINLELEPLATSDGISDMWVVIALNFTLIFRRFLLFPWTLFYC